jgi:CBS domain-containing protein
MVAIFAGASRALLTSVIFAFEVTREPNAVLPVLCGCATAYVISALLMRESIMTGKMASQGVRVPAEYAADSLAQRLVSQVMSAVPIFLRTTQTLGEVRQWLDTPLPEAQHQGYPVVDDHGEIAGVITRRDIRDNHQPAQTPLSELLRRPPVLVYDDCSLRDAADHMVNHEIGRLPVTRRSAPLKVVGIITRADLLKAQRTAREEDEIASDPVISWRGNGSRRAAHSESGPTGAGHS